MQNNSASENTAPQSRPQALQGRILVRQILINLFVWGPLLVVLMELRKHEILPSLLWVASIYFAVGIPLALLLYARWVYPLVKSTNQSKA